MKDDRTDDFKGGAIESGDFLGRDAEVVAAEGV